MARNLYQNTAVTHIDRSVKNNVQLTWTAPAAGTGSVVFRYLHKVQRVDWLLLCMQRFSVMQLWYKMT